ncbi:MAG TPA: malto-oligosyltrehalose trehalohydrolase [Bryobacteraceae bacterium]|nr:malto-oligosyltrehalose trehalohydrolase [Bryobacteraceae bacterium]
MQRRFPIGAEVLHDSSGVHFRVWAPRRRKVEVMLEGGAAVPLEREPGGHFSGLVAEAHAGSLYRFRLDGGGAFPDPASRFQPEGPHGPSRVVDASQFHWSDGAWPGASLQGQVISEIHIGTFTRQGTWEAARAELAELVSIGITAVEVMPVAEFPGRFGWGYDGVDWFAPTRLYGEPDDFRRFVDEAHRLGLAVVLDVVYNHFGPDGNYWKEYAADYFSRRYKNEWGEAINFDGPGAEGTRELVIANAAYWAEEYHIDGLRLDATQQIFDSSPENVMAALTRSFRAAAGRRRTFVVAENERQYSRLARAPEAGGYGLDGLWNDDFHHSARVAVTGRDEAYYSSYKGKPQELISALKYGYLFQGQWYLWQEASRGTPSLDLRSWQFVLFVQNHDQISNGYGGQRLDRLTSPGRYRAITALLLLAPGTPLLFQGQEFGATSPFCFFADHQGELRRLVRAGRLRFLSQFASLAQADAQQQQPDPGDPTTFEMCKLDFSERRKHTPVYRMHQDLLRLRREDAVFQRAVAEGRGAMDGAVLGGECFLLRYFGATGGDDRLLIVNLGIELDLASSPEPLIAPPENAVWELLWSSENPRYGGSGTPGTAEGGEWKMPGHAAVVLRPEKRPSV